MANNEDSMESLRVFLPRRCRRHTGHAVRHARCRGGDPAVGARPSPPGLTRPNQQTRRESASKRPFRRSRRAVGARLNHAVMTEVFLGREALGAGMSRHELRRWYHPIFRGVYVPNGRHPRWRTAHGSLAHLRPDGSDRRRGGLRSAWREVGRPHRTHRDPARRTTAPVRADRAHRPHFRRRSERPRRAHGDDAGPDRVRPRPLSEALHGDRAAGCLAARRAVLSRRGHDA